MAYATDIGIDLGTFNIVVYVKGKGIVVKEPAIVAYDRDYEKIRAFGEEARQMIGRTPGNIAGIRPLKEGVITDYVLIEEMLKYFIQKVIGRRIFKPRIVISVPTRVTEVERRAVEDATYMAGAREVFIVEEALASAIGTGIDILKPCGTMVVDIGGGVSDIAIVSLGGVVQSSSVLTAGCQFTESIIRYLRKNHLLFVGEQTAERIKKKIGSVSKQHQNKSIEIKGRNVFTGLPAKTVIFSDEITAPLRNTADKLADSVCAVLEHTTPELALDIKKRGIYLTGGGARLKGVDEVIKSKTGIDTIVTEYPENSVALGCGRYLEVIHGHD